MQYISRLLVIVSLFLVAEVADAQPPARKKENAKKEKKAGTPSANIKLTERAKNQYPGTVTPQEVDWKREVYRELDLKKEENASLYYPVEPMGNSMNLFTLLFNNILNGNIVAYSYNLDGYESFTEENIVDVKEMLDDYRIYYTEQDGEIKVGKSDIPSAEVLSYYVKESHYYDNQTGTYGTRITALCPVLHRSDDFGYEATKYPMFWLSYDEIAPYLAQQKIMTSSLNNISSASLDDYFTRGTYNGTIYKTVNLRNLAISQYCNDSTSIKKEQAKIEQQLKDFRTNLWNTKTVEEIRLDSINAAAEAAKDSTEATEEPVKKERKLSRREKKNSEVKATKEEKKKKEKVKSGNNKATRASVRRTRR